jgi:ABC-2 type transport system permease protein
VSRLLWVELDRFASRTLIRLGVVAVLVICGLATFSAWQTAAPPSQAERDQAQTYYEHALADWEKTGEQQVADCKEAEAAEKDASGNVDTDYGCDSMEPQLENWLGPAPSFDRDTTALLTTLSALFVLAPLLLAGSFISAEFSTGSIGNWLTFAPRRVRVYLSKVLAAGLAIIPVTAVGVGLVLAGSWLSYGYFDTLGAGATGTGVSSPVHVALRVVALAPVIALAGAALGFLARHTAAVLGIVLAWLVLVEGILASQVQALRPWTVATNVSAWVAGGNDYYLTQCTTSAGGQVCEYVPHFLPQTQAAAYLGAFALVVALAALLVFRRLDVG